jgi:CrcB protein
MGGLEQGVSAQAEIGRFVPCLSVARCVIQRKWRSGHVGAGDGMQAYVLVGLGGALGAMGRFGLGNVIGRVWSSGFPLATLLVNILGAVAMGLFIGLLSRMMPAWGEAARLFFAVGVLGGFTTFSSFSLETVLLPERGELLGATTYVLLSVVVCVLGLYLGLLVTRGVA